MKNQYLGDENDYLKYGLLRVISRESKLSIGVCWMLTADDDRPDGGKNPLRRPKHRTKDRETVHGYLKRVPMNAIPVPQARFHAPI